MTPAAVHDAVPLLAWLVIDALAVARLTILVTRDSFPPAKAARDTITRRWGASPWSELVVCPWCASPYLGAGVLALRLAMPEVWSLAALVAAFSLVAGSLATWTSD